MIADSAPSLVIGPALSRIDPVTDRLRVPGDRNGASLVAGGLQALGRKFATAEGCRHAPALMQSAHLSCRGVHHV